MNILEAILSAQNGAAVRQLGSQFGLGEEQTTAALSALVPMLAAGFQRNLQNPGGLESLAAALSDGHHQQYIEHPESLRQATAAAEGSGILGHVLGSRDVSREVASRASARTGVSTEIMKQLLPLAAALVMGALARQSAGGSPVAAGAGATGGGLADMLAPLLDRDRDGSILDDLAGMAGRFLNRS